MGHPSRKTSPDLTGIIRESAFNKVDFPQPLGPIIEVIFPFGIWTLIDGIIRCWLIGNGNILAVNSWFHYVLFLQIYDLILHDQ